MFAGAMVLVGWSAGLRLFERIVPAYIVMIPTTAVCFVLAGVALCSLSRARVREVRPNVAQMLGSFVFAIGIVMFAQRVAGWDFPINRLLFAGSVAAYPYRPVGLMAVNSGAGFTLFGAAIVALCTNTRRGHVIADVLAGLGLIVAAAAVVGYLYDVKTLYSFDQYAGMALPTALTFSLLGGGIVLAGTDRGLVRLLFGVDAAAVLARRLLPAALLVPIALGWLWLVSRRNEWVGRESGVSLFVVLNVTIFIALVLRNASTVRQTDEDRERTRLDAEIARASAEAAQLRAEEAQRNAEVANRTKSEFLAMMSHELRTPLNAIRGYAELLDMGVRGPVTDAQRADLARIRQSERHLLGLIEDLLNFTRIERGELTYALQLTSVDAATHQIAALIAPQMRAKHIDYQPEAADPSTFVRADPERLQQILLNLLSNAVKFSQEGGRITLTCDGDDSTVRIRVRDRGRGIPADKLEAIFQPFVQVDASHTRTTAGVGLGLAISRQLARAMQGEITAESELGIGSTFVLHLPRAHDAELMAPPRARQIVG